MCLLGLVLHRLIFRRLAPTSATAEVLEERSLLIGFGLMFVMQNVALLIWGADRRGYDYLADPLQYHGVIVTANRVLVFGVVVAISVALMIALRTTMAGKAARGMLQSPLGALLVGVDTRRLHPIYFAVGLAMAGAAGSLLKVLLSYGVFVLVLLIRPRGIVRAMMVRRLAGVVATLAFALGSLPWPVIIFQGGVIAAGFAALIGLGVLRLRGTDTPPPSTVYMIDRLLAPRRRTGAEASHV